MDNYEPKPVPSNKEANQEHCHAFAPHPYTQGVNFNFDKEVKELSFNLNQGDILLDKEHQTKFINLIYIDQQVFSFNAKDLGYCTICLIYLWPALTSMCTCLQVNSESTSGTWMLKHLATPRDYSPIY